MSKKAYLIVICDKYTNAILNVCVWSSPEWQQSRTLEYPTYVAAVWEIGGDSYHNAAKALLETIKDPVIGRRYNWLCKYITDETFRSYGVEPPKQPVMLTTKGHG